MRYFLASDELTLATFIFEPETFLSTPTHKRVAALRPRKVAL